MGRESLGVVQVLVWLLDGQRERIDALVGGQKRSAFIREAIDAAVNAELKRRERKRSDGGK
jgi:metal-responsive CopG/Arc/MetJ family transcriptional regulator